MSTLRSALYEEFNYPNTYILHVLSTANNPVWKKCKPNKRMFAPTVRGITFLLTPHFDTVHFVYPEKILKNASSFGHSVIRRLLNVF